MPRDRPAVFVRTLLGLAGGVVAGLALAWGLKQLGIPVLVGALLAVAIFIRTATNRDWDVVMFAPLAFGILVGLMLGR